MTAQRIEPASRRRTVLSRAPRPRPSAGAALAGGGLLAGRRPARSRSLGKKVIVIGIDGMDPRLCGDMMKQGSCRTSPRLSAAGGFSTLGTSTPPQSPVAWANFINGAGPGSHGIFDFIHRHPHDPCAPFYSAAETLPGEGYWEIGDHRLQLDFWPFNHQPPKTVLRRQGTPFWDYLDAAGIPSTFYDLPSNYPPSPSTARKPSLPLRHGNARHAWGRTARTSTSARTARGTRSTKVAAQRTRLSFDGDSASGPLVGPENSMLKTPRPVTVDFDVHRDPRPTPRLHRDPGAEDPAEAGPVESLARARLRALHAALLPTQHVSGHLPLLSAGSRPESSVCT